MSGLSPCVKNQAMKLYRLAANYIPE